jgi:hypothetical protein
MPLDREHRPQSGATAESPTPGSEGESSRSGGSVQFSSRGAIPAVSAGGRAGGQSASDQGYVQFKPGDKAELPKGQEGFDKMWAAHPHNNGQDPEQDTDSETVLNEHGLPKEFENTCAIRLSIMLNGIGQNITPAKTKAAGLGRAPHYSKKTKQYYILGANEVWQYIRATFRKPDVVFPPTGRYKDAAAFQKGYEEQIKPAVAGKSGIVAFDKIFTYSGTGHMDLFAGETLSDSSSWYESQRIELWYI